jgi:hypothetical protein
MVKEINNLQELKEGDIVFFMLPEGVDFFDENNLISSGQVGIFKDAIHVGIVSKNGTIEIAHIELEGFTVQSLSSNVGNKKNYLTDHIVTIRFEDQIAEKIAEIASDYNRFKKLDWKLSNAVRSFFSGHRTLNPSRSFTEDKKIEETQKQIICSEFVAAVYKEATNKLQDKSKRLNISSKCLPSQLLEELDRLKSSKLLYFHDKTQYLNKMLDILNINIERMKQGNNASKAKASKLEEKISSTLDELKDKNQLEKIMGLFFEIDPILAQNTGFTSAEPTSYKEIVQFIHSLGLTPEEIRTVSKHYTDPKTKTTTLNDELTRDSSDPYISETNSPSSDTKSRDSSSFSSIISKNDSITIPGAVPLDHNDNEVSPSHTPRETKFNNNSKGK